MSTKSTIDFLKPGPVFEDKFLVKITEIFHAFEYSKSLMTAVYLIEQDNFMHCNKSFIKLLGTNGDRVREEGWAYWFSLISRKDVSRIKYEITNFFATAAIDDSLTLQYTITAADGKFIYLKHELLSYVLENRLLAINYFFDITDEERSNQKKGKTHINHKNYTLRQQNMPVTTREMEVLKLIADGFSSKEIAGKLHISDHTAISHRKNLIEKFKVRNTAHLIKRTSKLNFV